jgi:hypothetical protein
MGVPEHSSLLTVRLTHVLSSSRFSFAYPYTNAFSIAFRFICRLAPPLYSPWVMSPAFVTEDVGCYAYRRASILKPRVGPRRCTLSKSAGRYVRRDGVDCPANR